jgi:DNA helicase-2/ATP-dependent DNA helicase PcrA
MPFKPRKAQLDILQYAGGPLAISAVPGAGKTTSLVLLASKLIVEDGVRPSQLLILTYTRSAAANIRERIRKALAEQGVPAHGLKAQTIHGFCHELLTRHAGRLGFPQGFDVMQPREQEAVLQSALNRFLEDPDMRAAWAASHKLDADNPEAASEAMGLSRKAASKAITAIKNLKCDLDAACAALSEFGLVELPPMIRTYERERITRGKLDYDDLILQVNRLLDQDPGVLHSLQRRFRYVLEDEAQDSTPGQKILIDHLVGAHGNLVRVGDSNQSIYATFTMNTPEYFRAFCAESPNVPMDESSRSCDAIIELANRLIRLTQSTHPEDRVAQGAFEANFIRPAEDGSNPPSSRAAIRWLTHESGKEEAKKIAEAVKAAYETPIEGKYMTQAILVARNAQAETFLRELGERGVPVAEGGAQGNASVMVVEVVLRMLKFLALDTDANAYREHLAEAHLAWVRHQENLFPDAKPFKERKERLSTFIRARGYDWRQLLSPTPGLSPERPDFMPPMEWGQWADFLKRAGSLLARRHLSPVDLVTAVAETFFDDPFQLSIAQAIALIVRRILYLNPEFRLSDVLAELDLRAEDQYRAPLFPATLEEIARGQGSHAEPEGPRPVKILTLHSSKGLEFDCVWIPGLNNAQDFPWLPEQARVTEQRVLMAERIISATAKGEHPELADLEHAAAIDQVAERLRLLYVGITRAERFLRLSYAKQSEWVLSRSPHLAPAEHIPMLEKLTP